MKHVVNKLKDGILVGVGIMLVFGITGLSYAALSWITQSEVTGGQTLSASTWNNMLNNQNYLKEQVESTLPKSGGTMAGDINMGTNKVTNLGAPISSTDAATKAYADSVSASSTSGGVAFCETRNKFTGNLGGLSGADSICASECGTGFKFASYWDLTNLDTLRGRGELWFRETTQGDTRTCNNRTTNEAAYKSRVLTPGGTINNYHDCNLTIPLACIRY